jgi:hypothetical protein
MLQAPRVRTPANVTLFFRVQEEDSAGLAGLTTSNFEISEDGQRISTFEAKPLILPKPGRFSNHTALVLDLSGSILGSGNLEAVKSAAQSFVTTVVPASADGSVQVGIWWFDGAAELHQLVPYTSSQPTLLNGIATVNSNLSNDNSTNLYGAVISAVASVRQRVTADKAQGIFSAGSVVLFTDGADQAGRRTEVEAVSAINSARSDVAVYTVGLGGEIREPTLRALGPDGFEFARQLDQLVESFTRVATKINNDANSFYILEYCSPKRQGQHTLEIEVRFGRRKGSATANFSAANFAGGCTVTAG